MLRSLGEVPWAEGQPQGREELAWLRGEEGQGGESREGVGRTPEDSRWLSQGCARDFSRCPAGGPSGGICVHVSGGGHVSEDMCPFLEDERGSHSDRGESRSPGQGHWGGGRRRPLPRAPGPLERLQWEDERPGRLKCQKWGLGAKQGGSRCKRSLMSPDAGRRAHAQRGAQRAEPKAVQRGVREVPREAPEHISKAGFQVP